MDSGDHSAPPSFSSGGWRSVEPPSPTYNQPTAAVENTTQPPSISSTAIRSSDPYDQHTLPAGFHDQPPSYSDFQHAGGNSITGGYGDRGFDNYGSQPPSLDALTHENNSAVEFGVYNGYEQPAPSLSAVAPIIPSNPGVSDATPVVDPLENVGFSIVGRNFPRGSLI